MPRFNFVWQGDSIELCKRFQPKRQVACIITDPPFGTNNQSNQAVTAEGRAEARKIENDETPEIAIATFQAVMHSLLPATVDEADAYVFTSHQVLKEWLMMCDEFMPQYGFNRKAILIWEKDGPGIGDLNNWGMGVEFILFFKKGKRERTDRRRNVVLHYPQIRPDKLIHPHQKPEALLADLIRHSTSPNDFIVDPFGGSGATGVAAMHLERNSVCIELSQKNADKAQRFHDDSSGGMF